MTVPLFVYGTLRQGESNFSWAFPCVERVDRNVHAPGSLWFWRRKGSFPVAKFSDAEGGRIVGDLLWCDDESWIFDAVCTMEERAGYEMVQVPVTVGARPAPLTALGFQFLGDPDPLLLIPDGDWCAAVRRWRDEERVFDLLRLDC